MNSIPVPYSTRPPLCNTWLVDGAEPALIDAGLRVPDQLDDLARRLGGRPLSRLLITHGHPDHVSAVDAVRAHVEQEGDLRTPAIAKGLLEA